MSGFWSGWVILLAALTIGLSVFLFVWGLWVRIPTQADGTTGHDWDGIREGMHKLPWWWIVYVRRFGFLVALGYLVLYPGLGSFKGLLGWSSQEPSCSSDDACQRREARGAAQTLAYAHHRAVGGETSKLSRIGHALYLDNCAACHGSNALGNPALGAPDLTDAVWQYGGDGDSILTSILDGRSRVMPPWGACAG